MIILNGIDIIEISRIENCVKKYGDKFLKRFFTQSEIDYCFKFKEPYTHLAGRFASKEAGAKALSSIYETYLKDFEVIIKDKKPQLIYIPNKRYIGELSISHTKDIAIASVIFIVHKEII